MSDNSNKNIAAPHVVRKKPIIAMTWATDDYEDIVAASRPTFEQFGIEYVRRNDPVRPEDHAGIKMWRNWPTYYITRDKIWLEFLQSCRGLYERVLLVNSDVQMRNPLLPKWLEGPSVLWRYTSLHVYCTNDGRLRDIATDMQILDPYDSVLYATAIDLAKQSRDGYDMEYTMPDALHETQIPVHFEYASNRRFIKIEEMVNDQGPSIFHWPGARPKKFVNRLGGVYYQHIDKNSTATYDYYEKDTIFTITTIDSKKLERYVADPNLASIGYTDDLALYIPKRSITLASMLENWLLNYPQSNDDIIQSIKDAADDSGTTFHQVSVLAENCPAYMQKYKWIKQFSKEPVFQVDDWIICPGIGLTAPESIWAKKPYILHLPHTLNIIKLLQIQKFRQDINV